MASNINRCTVPFHSIQQSRVTGPFWRLKCHGGHGQFHWVPKSSHKHVLYIENFRCLRRYIAKNFGMSRQLCKGAETEISAGPSRVTGPVELNEMGQYHGIPR